jgi:bifunctional DNase/RNase
VSELPRGQREAVYLFYLSGLTHREAAQELGVSVNAVKARLHQGRLKLSHMLADLRTTEVPVQPTDDFVPVHISDVRSTTHNGADRFGIVLLESADASRHLPIFIGLPEATALAFSLENVEMPRPMTYQLAASLLEACGGRVVEVRISELAEYIFLATVVVETPVGVRETDARPSDALNLAVLAGAPMTANGSMLRVLDDMTWWNDLTSRAEFVREVRDRQELQRKTLLERVRPVP